MTAAIASVHFQLAAYARSRRAVPPLVATAVLLVVLHAGGAADPALGYATSAALLFPVFAWAARQLLDTEPDVQRQLSAVALGGPARSAGSALAAALLGTLPLTAVALAWPWAVGAFVVPRARTQVGLDLLVGLALHLLSAVPATLLGGLDQPSRAAGPRLLGAAAPRRQSGRDPARALPGTGPALAGAAAGRRAACRQLRRRGCDPSPADAVPAYGRLDGRRGGGIPRRTPAKSVRVRGGMLADGRPPGRTSRAPGPRR